MFYSHNILTKKGGSLGIVWIAANFQPGAYHITLTRREYCSVSIRRACEEVMSPRNPMALRLSANLMVGIVRVHQQQTNYIYVDSKHVWQRIRSTYDKNRPTTDLPTGHARSDAAVTLPDPTSQVALNTTFPGHDHSFSLDSLLVTDLFSMSVAPTLQTPNAHSAQVGGSPYTADPRDISMEEDAETPLETLQLQVPGEGGDFGDSVLVELSENNVPMRTLNMSDSMSVAGGVGDSSCDSVHAGAGQGGVEGGREGEEEEREGKRDSVLLFDVKTNAFQLYNEVQGKVSEIEQGTPVPQPMLCDGQPDQPPPQGKPASKRVRRKLAFDALIKTKSSTVKHNMDSAHTTLRDKHTLCHPVLARVKPAVLLGQPVCVASLRNPRLQSMWHHYLIQPNFRIQQEESNSALLHSPSPVASILSDREAAREHSTSGHLSARDMELMRAGDDRSLDSHQTTDCTGHVSDISSLTSTHHHSNLGFETSSALRQTGLSRVPQPTIDGLSPIADVETEASFSTQEGDLGYPDLMDVSYDTPRPPPGHVMSGHPPSHGDSPGTESEPLAYFSHVSSKLEGRAQIDFQELLPPKSSRKTASRAFAHVLELVTSQILTATQDKPYATITLQRGERF